MQQQQPSIPPAPPTWTQRFRKWTNYLLAPVLGLFFALLILIFWMSSSYPFELFCHFIPEYFLISLVIVTLAVVYRNRYWMVLSVLIAVIVFWQIAPFLPYKSFSVPEDNIPNFKERRVRILLANVRTLNPEHFRLINLIGESKPHIVVLHEIDHQWASSLRSLSEEMPGSVTFPRGDDFGIGIFSKYQISDGEIIFPGNAEIPSARCTIHLPGGAFSLFSTHPLPPVSEPYFKMRNVQLKEVARLVRERKNGPALVAGDLNMSPWSPYFDRFLKASGLRNARIGHGLLPSWPVDWPYLLTPIDHILVSPDIQVLSIRRGPDIGSDHYPIIADILLPAS